MYQEQFTKLGQVTDLAVTANLKTAGAFWFSFQTTHAGKLKFLMTENVARALWFNLTHILFPKAADQLTRRAATATMCPA